MSEFLVVNSKRGPKTAVPGHFFSKSRSDCSLELILRLRGQKRMQRDGANLQYLFLAIFCYKTGENDKKWHFLRRQTAPQPYIYICCRVKMWSKICLFLSQNVVQVFSFFCFSKIFFFL